MERKNLAEKYNNEFKKTIVDLYHTGNSAKELSGEYGVSEVTIYKWVKEFTPIGLGEESMTPKELSAIQKENLRLKQEVEILKKAMAIFAKK
ncbi:transposase [Peribacillus muralis]|uniref:transposase n=1 Tax=Peribacillus muralis TaxID=264697 RepID=UPI003D0905F2